ncbi:putative ankyrin repeat protein [Phytophthora citrophthora]|uniref:Ankyrin repeat protein n=1 Tax=Phytophthora citrophthora TaxID=4793 RepID=A0AAD9LPK8_9STRA|nr:putative ankyrin repeat protein [Phytophthora citrophthora]
MNVRILVNAGVNLNAEKEDGMTALMLAAMNGRSDVVRVLVDAGANVNLKDKNGFTALMYANGRSDIGRMLVVAGADMNLVNKSGSTALTRAFVFEYSDTVRVLVEAGADLSFGSKGSSSSDTVQMLLNAGVDLNLVSEDNWSSLMLAARSECTDIMHMLIDAGAEMEAARFSALMAATKCGHPDAVQMLVNAGTGLNAVNDDGKTPLLYTVQHATSDAGNRHVKIARILIENGANVNARDNGGQTSLIKATRNNSRELIEILLQHGARVDSSSLAGDTALVQSEDIRSVLQLHYWGQQFHDRATTLLAEASTGSPPSNDQVLGLVSFVTSVYDLRLLLTLNSMVWSDEEKSSNQQTTELLNAAFKRILAQRLVLDDNACVYFRLVLEHCANSHLLTPSQFMK